MKRLIFSFLIGGAILIGTTATYSLKLTQDQSTPISNSDNSATPTPLPTINSITALGRIEPWGEVIKVAASPNLGGAKLQQILVKEGDKIKTNQIIAVLDSYYRKKTAVITAQQTLQLAQANLSLVKAGAKKGEIIAQEAEIQRLQSQLQGEVSQQQENLRRLQYQGEGEQREQIARINQVNNELIIAQADLKRYEELYQGGAISKLVLDQYRLKVAVNQQQLNQEKATLDRLISTRKQEIREAQAQLQQTVNTLNRQILSARGILNKIAEVRPLDVNIAQAQVNQAKAQLMQTEADLELSYIRSPLDGQVLKINSQSGELVKSDEGLADIGVVDRMMVIAEVYESDISKVKTGQKAEITSESGSFSGTLRGQVAEIGREIGKKEVLETDPASDVDVRVIEVKILLDPPSSQQVAHLTYSKVIARLML